MRKKLALLLFALPWIISLALVTGAETSRAFAPTSLAYVLQVDKLARKRGNAVELLKRCGRDLIVIDRAYTAGSDGLWYRSEIEAIRKWKAGRRVVAYLSIGEAEDYRDYWDAAWDKDRDGKPDAGAPSFLCNVNPEWAGNYLVKYWDQRWQQIVLDTVADILRQGFDGLYLDRVDAFEDFERDGNRYFDNRVNPETGRTYRQDMIRFVKAIATAARFQAKSGCLVIPQNGVQLLDDASYAAVADGLGVEDLFTNDDAEQSEEDCQYRLRFIRKFRQSGKPVFDIEYCSTRTLKNLVARRAAKVGLAALVTNRDLSILGTMVREGM